MPLMPVSPLLFNPSLLVSSQTKLPTDKQRIKPKSTVKYAYFQSADGYYSSWDIASTLHPQTLLAYEKNGEPLPVDNGAPLRLASPIKLGYKQSKWVTRVTFTSNLSRFQGYWEDQGYEWFAGL